MAVTLAELETFLRQSPPRHVPPTILRKAFRSTPGFIIVLGLILSAVGMLFTAIFFPFQVSADIRLSMRGAETQGTVTARERTAYNENNRNVSRYRFRYNVTGISYDGVCYSSTIDLETNAPAVVVYLPSEPPVARLKGCRLSKFGWGAVLIAIMPATGLAILLFAHRSRSRIRRLLAHGRFAMGRIARVENTTLQVNRQNVYRVVVGYKADTGREMEASYYVFCDAAAAAACRKKEAQEAVGVLYDQADPKRIVLADDLLG